MTPLELMQFKQTLSQQTQAQAQAQAEAAEKQRADETEQLVATVVERVCKTVGMPTAPTVPARTAKKQGAAMKTDDEGEDDDLVSTGSRNSQRRQKRKQHQEAVQKELTETKRQLEYHQARLAFISRQSKLDTPGDIWADALSDGEAPSLQMRRAMGQMLEASERYAQKTTPDRNKQDAEVAGAVAGAMVANRVLFTAKEAKGNESKEDTESTERPTRARGRRTTLADSSTPSTPVSRENNPT